MDVKRTISLVRGGCDQLESRHSALWCGAVIFVPLAFLLSGCKSIPSFSHPVGKPSDLPSPTVASLVTHIQCEIYRASKQTGSEKLQSLEYVAFAQLTVDVTNFQGTAPQLNFIHPYLTPMTNLTYTIGGQVTGTQHRNITQSFTIDLTKAKDNADKTCQKDTESDLLSGELGLDAVIADGLHQAANDDFSVYPTPASSTQGVNQTSVPRAGPAS